MIAFKRGYTLMELLIVATLIALIAAAVIIILRPDSQIKKTWNAQRKRDLSVAQRILEDYYNDHNGYPKHTDICYDGVTNDGAGSCSCHVCGLKGSNFTLSSYLTRQFCDPENPKKSYLYQFACDEEPPSWYRICAALSETRTGEFGTPGYYSYGVSSSQTDPDVCKTIVYDQGAASSAVLTPTGTGGTGGNGNGSGSTGGSGGNGSGNGGNNGGGVGGTCQTGSFCKKNNVCNFCGDRNDCAAAGHCDQPLLLYSNPQCTLVCR